MVKRVLAIAVLMYIAFLAEFVLYNAFGSWGKAELIVIAVVFCNLYWGIRYSLWAAFVAGVLKDAFSTEPFGIYLFVYIVAAFLTTWIRQNLYQPGSRFSRAVVTFFVLLGIFILEMFIHMRSYEVRLPEAVAYILVPQMALSMLLVTFVFHSLRDMVVKLKL